MLKLSCRVGFPVTSADRTLLIFLGFLMLRVYFVSICPSSPPPTPGDEVGAWYVPKQGWPQLEQPHEFLLAPLEKWITGAAASQR